MADAALSKSQPGQRKKRLLLIVDGDAGHLYYTSMLLQMLDYTIYTTRRAEEALEIMEISLPALVLTELELQEMNGLELLKRIRQNAKTKSIPVIVFSTKKDLLTKEQCFKAGATAFVDKPVNSEVLYAAIQRATESTPRNFIRLKTCLNVVIGEAGRIGSGSSEECVTALSESGIYVSTPGPRPKGAQLLLTLYLEDAAIRFEGTVLYSTDRNTGPFYTSGMGIKFVHIRPEDRELIKRFILTQITADLPDHRKR